MRRPIPRLLAPLLLMAVIFWLSDQPNLNSGLGAWDTVLRKLAHMLEYGLLWWLLWRAMDYGHPLPPVAMALVYAVSDEYHQTLVQGRSGAPLDWAIDAAGVGLAGAAVVLHGRLVRRRAHSV